MKKTDPPITAQLVINRSLEDVWSAISKPEQMKQWYFAMIPDFKAIIGFETSFIVENEGRVFDHHWKVTEVIPREKLVYEWRFTHYPGAGYTAWDLFKHGAQTKLLLTNIVTEDYPNNIPEFTTESCQAGWDYFIGQSLKEYLSKLDQQ